MSIPAENEILDQAKQTYREYRVHQQAIQHGLRFAACEILTCIVLLFLSGYEFKTMSVSLTWEIVIFAVIVVVLLLLVTRICRFWKIADQVEYELERNMRIIQSLAAKSAHP